VKPTPLSFGLLDSGIDANVKRRINLKFVEGIAWHEGSLRDEREAFYRDLSLHVAPAKWYVCSIRSLSGNALDSLSLTNRRNVAVSLIIFTLRTPAGH